MMPIPNDTRHQSLSIFTDIDTLKKEERARRRVLRIQQVRQQSKFIASQVIARSKHIQKHQERLSNQEKDLQLKEWKHEKINSLRAEVTFGLEDLGGSYKAVEKEIEAVADRDAKISRDKKLAKERGRVASQELQRQLQDDKLREERIQQGREELQVLEKIRARSVASLPVPPSTVQQPISYRPLTEKSSVSNKDCKNTVEVYNYSNPLPSQYFTQPDNAVQKLSPRTSQAGAKEQAEKELQVFAEKQCKEDKEKELTCWLGGAANVRKTLEKQYSHLIKKLPELEQKESQANPPVVTLADIEREEKRQHIKHSKTTKKKLVKSSTQVTHQTMEPNYDNTDSAVPKQDLTAFPLAQFTAEETGALGATASSLQALLGSLVDESRRRLQEVVDDDFDFNDEDFEEPNLSPPGSPPPPIPPGTSDVKFNVNTTHQVTDDGPSLPPASTITSEVHVSVTNKGRSKRRKKKSKSKPDGDFQSSPINTYSTRQDNTSKDSQSENKKDTEEVKTVLDNSQQNTILKSVEIDELGVAYIKKTNETTECKVIESNVVSSTSRGNEVFQHESVQVATNFTENVQYKLNNKHSSFVSNSTQYHSPPGNLLADENIDKYLRSIELEKKQVEELLQTKQKSDQGGKEINLPQYINKLLTMTRDSVDQLSVSDVTETSSDLGGQKKRKKKNKKLKTHISVSGTSSNSENSPSTADSHVTLSVPSLLSGTASDSSVPSNGQIIISSSSEDSNLKFSESSSLKESSNSEIGHINKTDNNFLGDQSIHLDSTSYRTLEELSSHVPNNPQLVAPSKVPVKLTNSSDVHLGVTNSPHSNDLIDPLARFPETARLSTIVEADSSVVIEEECVPDSRKIEESNSSMLDIEAELKKRGLPTLQIRSGDPSSTLLSPELDKKLKDLKVAPWSSSMMARMKKANSLSSSSDEAPPHLSDSNTSDLVPGRPLTDQGICHSTPVSMEGPATSELTYGNQSQRFFLQDSIVSPISATEEKGSKSFLSS